MDFQSMNDEQLAEIQRSATVERNRRDVISGIPLQVAELAAQYREGGGDEAALRDALDANALDTLTGDDDGNLG